MTADSTDDRRRIVRQALSIGFALAPFGFVFGVAAADAGLSMLEASGFSALVFAGSSQFAAVGVLADGGGALAAIGAGLLLNLRSLAFGVLMAPALRGSVAQRALVSHLVIDESTAVGATQETPELQRFGFLAGGLSVFIIWNLTTVLGAAVASSADDLVADWGLDAAAPAAFLALLWPRLTGPDGSDGRRIAALGAVIAAATIPFAPVGVPILLAGLGVLAGRRGMIVAAAGGNTAVVVLVGLAVGTYLLKAAGPLLLGGRQLPASLDRVARRVPAALLAALVVVSGLAVGESIQVDARLAGLVAAGVALWRRLPFVVVVIVAVAVTAIVRRGL